MNISPQELQGAKDLTNPLLTLNAQSVNPQNIANVSDTLNNTQIAALVQAFNSNPQLQTAADTLTQRLRQDGRLTATQRVVGFQNGRLIVSNRPLTAAAAAPASVSPADTQRNLQTAQTMTNALLGVDVQNANIQGVVNASETMSPAQVSAFTQTMNVNPHARMAADALTQRLQREGKIGASQRVIGFQDGKVIVTGGSAAAGAPTAGGNPPPNPGNAANTLSTTLLNGMTTLNVQGSSVQAVADLTTILNQDQAAAFIRALEGNVQAQQNAQALTERMRAERRIRADQRAVAFQDGRVLVMPVK
jgi:hypothetical protein